MPETWFLVVSAESANRVERAVRRRGRSRARPRALYKSRDSHWRRSMFPSPPSSPDGPGGLGSSFLAGARLVLRDLGRHVATDMPLASVHEESRRSAGAIAELPGACGSDWAKEWNSAHGTATLSGWKLALQSPFILDEFSDDPVEQLRCSVVGGVRAREIRPVQIGRNPDRYVPRGVAPAMGEHIPRGPVALKQDPAGCAIAQMWRREIVEAVSDQNFWFGSRELDARNSA